MDGTMRVFQKRFAIWILLRILENPGRPKKEIIEEDQGSHMAKYDALKDLVDAGLVRVDEDAYVYGPKPLYLTELGEKVAIELKVIHDIMPYSECSSREYK